MSGLRELAEQLGRTGGHPTPYATRKTHAEKVATRFIDRPVRPPRETEDWDAFLTRIGLLQEAARDG